MEGAGGGGLVAVAARNPILCAVRARRCDGALPAGVPPATAAGRQRRAWGVAGWDGGSGSGVVAAMEGPP